MIEKARNSARRQGDDNAGIRFDDLKHVPQHPEAL
jgi:hypothetical protein